MSTQSAAIIIGLLIGSFLGILIAGWQMGRTVRKDNLILRFLESGQISANEAREWRNTGKPPRRITKGALSRYGDD